MFAMNVPTHQRLQLTRFPLSLFRGEMVLSVGRLVVKYAKCNKGETPLLASRIL